MQLPGLTPLVVDLQVHVPGMAFVDWTWHPQFLRQLPCQGLHLGQQGLGVGSAGAGQRIPGVQAIGVFAQVELKESQGHG